MYRCSIRKRLKYMGKRHMADVNEYKEVIPISFAEQWIGNPTISVEMFKVLKKKWWGCINYR
jgi:hypothetical protein